MKFTKNYSTFYPKNCHYALKNMGLGSEIRKKPLPDPKSRVQKGTGSHIRFTVYRKPNYPSLALCMYRLILKLGGGRILVWECYYECVRAEINLHKPARSISQKHDQKNVNSKQP
jgi:hypothetical protein